MANRRKFLAGLGALATGSAAAVGTGAFTSTAAGRGVSVSVAGDQDAYLQLTAGNSPHVTTENGQIVFDFDGSQVGGDGLNTGAWTKFNDLFSIQNESGNPIAIWLDEGSANAPDVNNGQSANFAQQSGIPDYKVLWSFSRDSQPDYYAESDVGYVGGGGYGDDTLGNALETGIDDDGVLAPVNVNPDKNNSIFNRTNQHPAVLTGGDSISINLQFNTTGINPSNITDATGNVVLNAYSHDFAVDLQS